MSAHYLYRCYDADGLLLYIGCTTNPARRLVQHKKSGNITSLRLARFIASYVVDADVYPTRDAGRTAEKAAIRAEQPLLNVQHRGIPGWRLEPDYQRYLAGEPTRDWRAYLEELAEWDAQRTARTG